MGLRETPLAAESGLKVGLLPSQAVRPGGMGAQEKARQISDLPMLAVVVELDRGSPANFHSTNLRQVNGFGIKAMNLGCGIDPEHD